MPRYFIYVALLFFFGGLLLSVSADETEALEGPRHTQEYYDDLYAKGLMPDFDSEFESEDDKKRSNQDHCHLCAECRRFKQDACKDLGGQLCNAWSGGGTALAPHGFKTDLIANLTITARFNSNVFIGRMDYCYVAYPACPAEGSWIEIHYPDIRSDPLCRDAMPRIGDVRVMAFGSLQGDFSLTTPTTFFGRTSTCYFNKYHDELTAYEYGLLNDGPGTTANVVQAW